LEIKDEHYKNNRIAVIERRVVRGKNIKIKIMKEE
jgi:hypothetical protein